MTKLSLTALAIFGQLLNSISDGFQPATTRSVLNHYYHQHLARNICGRNLLALRDSRSDDDIILPPTVWIQDAEPNFVDEEENLEEGEICLKSVKAFASAPSGSDSSPRFLSAGALVQRPLYADMSSNSNSVVCDCWIADACLEDGGPNLQFQGPSLILDELFRFHLERQRIDPIDALRTFVVQCEDGDIESETMCASYMAAKSRGFRPLKELLRKSSVYTKSTYIGGGGLDGMVLDLNEARDIYHRLIKVVDCPNHDTLSRILHLLLEEDLVQRFTIKRFSAR